jgi:prepilin-type N-terminal cleavage/methylation domain-containing protein
MFQRIREARKNESGFTLIELLIVIVILGVLAGIVVFAVQAFNNDGKVAACKADVKNVEIATEAYYAKTNPQTYPVGADSTARIAVLTAAKYLKEAPGTANYTVALAADGTVTGTLVGGGAC